MRSNSAVTVRGLARAALTWFLGGMLAGCAAAPESRETQYGGLPPDCWTQARDYQTDGDDWNWASRTRIERVVASKPEAVTVSPNGAYYFAVQADEQRQAVLVFAEKDHQVRISFADARGLTGARWINERLLYLRVWWGRVAASDLIIDVEKGRVVLSESTHDGTNAMQQHQEMCPRLGGCRCIQKAPP